MNIEIVMILQLQISLVIFDGVTNDFGAVCKVGKPTSMHSYHRRFQDISEFGFLERSILIKR